MTVEIGVVKVFYDERRFGFLYVLNREGKKTGEEIFFHVSSRRRVGNDGKGPVFLDKITSTYPKKEEMLIFQRGPGQKGDQAVSWCYAHEWDDNM